MKSLSLAGRRVHIAGSASKSIDINVLRYVHAFIHIVVTRILSSGGGLVVTLGGERPHSSQPDVSCIFDWTILEAANDYFDHSPMAWPESQGLPLVCVGLPKCLERIPEHRRSVWEALRDSGKVQLERVQEGLSTGGVLRELQAQFGDMLILLGGDVGVQHLADLYARDHKPVIPIDAELGAGRGASKQLFNRAISHPSRFFEYQPSASAGAALSKLTFKESDRDPSKLGNAVIDLISHLARPRAFYVRVQNPTAADFAEVDQYFREVVDPVVIDAGYDPCEIGKSPSSEPFLNAEIFKDLDHSSLVIVDISGLRYNCFLELGFALGIPKKVMMTARKDTELPFDVSAFPCNFWGGKTREQEIETLKEFMQNNSKRTPIRLQEDLLT